MQVFNCCVCIYVAFTLITDLLTSTAGEDFDLADALDPNNDIGGKDKNKGQGGGWDYLPKD